MPDLNLTRSYTANAQPTPEVAEVLRAYAELFSRAVRGTYAQDERDARTGVERSAKDSKAWVMATYQLTSRQAHAVIVEARAKRDAILALDKDRLFELTARLTKQKGVVARGKKSLAEHRKSKGRTFVIHKPKRLKLKASVFIAQTKVAKLQANIKGLKARLAAGITHLVFGTKKLLRQRAALDGARAVAKQTGTPAEVAELDRLIGLWLAKWTIARESQVYLVGSKDESAGCQGCQAALHEDGTASLRIKLPPALGDGHVVVDGIGFAPKHGLPHLKYALAQQAARTVSKQELTLKAMAAQAKASPQPAPAPVFDADGVLVKPKKAPLFSQKEVQGGAAITWRLMCQADGSLKVAFSTDVAPAAVITSIKFGAIGIDLNSGFLSVVETDPSGNFLDGRNYQTPEIGKSANQREAIRGDVVAAVIKRCVAAKKPLVLEDLDFQAKKRELSLRSPNVKRKLAALAYTAIYDLFCARAQDAGVQVITVNPAYTSTQGWVRYAARKGWSVHIAAAGVIARRGQELAEVAPTAGKLKLPVGGTAVELEIPEEISKSDVSCRWAVLHRFLTQAIASHYRARRVARPPRQKGVAVVLGETPRLKPGLPGASA